MFSLCFFLSRFFTIRNTGTAWTVSVRIVSTVRASSARNSGTVRTRPVTNISTVRASSVRNTSTAWNGFSNNSQYSKGEFSQKCHCSMNDFSKNHQYKMFTQQGYFNTKYVVSRDVSVQNIRSVGIFQYKIVSQ